MSSPRLIIFCSDVDTELAPAMDSLAELFELAKVSAPRLVSIVPPEPLRAAGFRALTIHGERLSAEETARRLSPHLHAVTRTFARTLREEVLGIFAHVEGLEAQACFHPPGGFPRSAEGDAFQVLRQAAGWLETDQNAFLAHFGAYDLATAKVPAEENASESVDEEDDFVERRLQAAAEWMARYRQAVG
ncbi:MAG: hypothetical protein ACJ790_15035 [Myxococcaceae bacterium]